MTTNQYRKFMIERIIENSFKGRYTADELNAEPTWKLELIFDKECNIVW